MGILILTPREPLEQIGEAPEAIGTLGSHPQAVRVGVPGRSTGCLCQIATKRFPIPSDFGTGPDEKKAQTEGAFEG